jgi:hypothetical protein
MKTLNLVLLIFTCAISQIYAQGSIVFDQESSNDETYPYGGPAVQFYGTVGQSFTPTLSMVEFFRVKLYDIAPGNATGATLIGTLRSNAINGPVLGTTAPLVLNDGFAGSVNFLFTGAIAVVPNTTYFFQAVVQSGDNWGITTLLDSYSNGAFYGGNFPFSGTDLWFREGIVVPEPSILALFVMAGGVAVWRANRRRQR